MRLRILSSVALAAVLLASLLVVLALYLNPGVRLADEAVAVLGSLFLPWFVLASGLLLPLAVLLPFAPLPQRVLRPPFPRLPWLTTFVLIAVGLAAALFWWNLLSYRHSVPVAHVRGLLGSAVALSAGLLAIGGVALDVLLFPARRRGPGPGVVVLVVMATVLVPVVLLPGEVKEPAPLPLATDLTAPVRRVTVIGVDGLGPAQLRDGVEGGGLAGFARLMRRGSHGPLGTLRPTEAAPIWTSIVTGRLPRDHGIKGAVSYRLRGRETSWDLLPKGALVALLERFGGLRRQVVTPSSRRRSALWQAADAFGMRSGVVRLVATFPAEPMRGFMLSPAHHLLAANPAQATRSLRPPDLLAEVAARVVQPGDVDAALLAEFVDPDVHVSTEDDERVRVVQRALAADLTYERAGETLRQAYDPHLFITCVGGLDAVGHAFTREAQPGHFGNVSPEAVRKYGRVTTRYAALVAEWVDARARTLAPDEVLLVVSGHGMQPVPTWRRLLDAMLGEGEGRTGTHEAAPEGYLMAIGSGIRAGGTLQGASVLDVAPTVLYLMGLPVGRDMEGRVLTEMLDDEVARTQQVTFVPSYQSLAVRPAGDDAVPPLPEEMP